MATIKTMSRPIAMSGSRDLVPATPKESVPVVHSHQAEGQQAVATLPGGQSISVVTNHNIHLPFKEWILRGIIGAVGGLFAFPFRVVGNAINSIVESMIGIVKVAIMIILAPTLVWLGIQLLGQMTEEESIESGTATIVENAGKVATGIGKGIDGEAGE